MKRNPSSALCLAFLVVLSHATLGAQQAEPKQDTAGKIDYAPFTLELEHWRRPSLDQGRTGTCWSFATTSFFESELMRMTKKEVDLSEIWFMRAAAIEKARRHLATQGRTRFDEGGLSHDIPFIVKQHGLALASQFSGLKDGARRHNHAKLWQEMRALVDTWTKAGGELTPERENELAAVLKTHLGSFVGDDTSPAKVLSETKIPMNEYVEVMSTTSRPFGARGTLKVPDNWLEYSDYMNVSVDDLILHLERALKAGFTVALDVDVSEPGFGPKGVAQMPEDLEQPGAVTQALREEMFVKGDTTDDHLMHIVGLMKDAAGKRWYLVKDSGGEGRWRWKGHMAMSENYVRAKGLGFMVHKDALVQP
jgi:bleomycin hydrolase